MPAVQDSIHTLVIGAGVVGLAAARALAQTGRDVIVVERHGGIGEETSSRNSEVIHAGIYYPTASLKARLCVAGKRALYAYCEEKTLEHRRCGKLIVASQASQETVLDALATQGAANGVEGLERIDAETLRRYEPAVRGSAALWSPSTGILDSHALMLALQGDLEAAGGFVALATELVRATVLDDGFALELRDGDARVTLRARELVNAAGLAASSVAQRIAGLPAPFIPTTRFAKGNYFTLLGTPPFRHLVYPVPEPGGLGVHATLDLGGRVRFGPDVEWLETPNYTVDPNRAAPFYAAIRRYWPALPDGSLEPAYAGVRPKLVRRGEPAADFRIDAPERHGVAGLVNLFGIESPGLTAALAIGDEVVDCLDPAA